jgi:hypothetical protein
MAITSALTRCAPLLPALVGRTAPIRRALSRQRLEVYLLAFV